MPDISSFLPILIAIGYGLYQLFKLFGKNTGASPQPKSPPPTDPFGGAGKGGDTSWDDLMEALGQKEKPKSTGPAQVPPPIPRIEPVQPKVRTYVPPPVPQKTPEVRQPVRRIETPVAPQVPYEIYQPKIAEDTALKFKTFDTENAQASHAPVVLLEPTPSGMPNSRFRHFLADRNRLREAIVLNEILNKPVAMR